MTYQHYKGGFYHLHYIDAAMESDGTPMAVYSCVKTGKVYVRPQSEFVEKFRFVGWTK